MPETMPAYGEGRSELAITMVAVWLLSILPKVEPELTSWILSPVIAAYFVTWVIKDNSQYCYLTGGVVGLLAKLGAELSDYGAVSIWVVAALGLMIPAAEFYGWASEHFQESD